MFHLMFSALCDIICVCQNYKTIMSISSFGSMLCDRSPMRFIVGISGKVVFLLYHNLQFKMDSFKSPGVPMLFVMKTMIVVRDTGWDKL